MRLTGNLARTEEMENAYKILVINSKGKSPLGRSRHIWNDNIKMYLTETGCGGWTGLNWLRTGFNGGLLWTR